MPRGAKKSSERGGIGGRNSSEWKIDPLSVYAQWLASVSRTEQKRCDPTESAVTPRKSARQKTIEEKRRCDPNRGAPERAERQSRSAGA